MPIDRGSWPRCCLSLGFRPPSGQTLFGFHATKQYGHIHELFMPGLQALMVGRYMTCPLPQRHDNRLRDLFVSI